MRFIITTIQIWIPGSQEEEFHQSQNVRLSVVLPPHHLLRGEHISFIVLSQFNRKNHPFYPLTHLSILSSCIFVPFVVSIAICMMGSQMPSRWFRLGKNINRNAISSAFDSIVVSCVLSKNEHEGTVWTGSCQHDIIVQTATSTTKS